MSRESKQKILGLTSEDFLFVVFNPLAVAVAFDGAPATRVGHAVLVVVPGAELFPFFYEALFFFLGHSLFFFLIVALGVVKDTYAIGLYYEQLSF